MNNNTVPPIWIICIISGLPLFAETVYTPSITYIANELLTSINNVEHTITIYLVGFALGILFWGILSDYIGRKLSVIIGLLTFMIGCIMCYFSKNIESLMVGRVIQSFGGSIGSVLGQAIVRDAFEGKELTKVYLSTSIAMAIFPAIGPSIGAFLLKYFYWQASFLFLVFFAILMIIFIFFKLPETNNINNKQQVNVISFARIFIKDKRVLSLGLILGMSLGLTFSYFAEAPFFFIEKLKMSQEYYGRTFLFISFSAILGGLLAKRMNKKSDQKTIVHFASYVIFFGTVSFLISVILYESLSLSTDCLAYFIVICRCCLLFGQVMFGNVILSVALTSYKNQIGTASSFFGLYYYSITSIITFIMGSVHNGSLYAMPVYFSIVGTLLMVLYQRHVRRLI